MTWMTGLGGMAPISGFHVEGYWVRPITSSSLAWAGFVAAVARLAMRARTSAIDLSNIRAASRTDTTQRASHRDPRQGKGGTDVGASERTPGAPLLRRGVEP